MGLDMYAWAVPRKHAEQFQTDMSGNRPYEVEELFYWRKHHDLHGWMEELYQSRGGNDTFNCVKLRLKEEDLDLLEQSIKLKSLPETTGFFFGNNPPDEDSDSEDLRFVALARQAIADDKAVFYDSWW